MRTRLPSESVKPRKRTSVNKSKLEYSIFEALSMLSLPDDEFGREELNRLLTIHDALCFERSVMTPKGDVAHYYDKKGMEELKAVVQINEERRQIAEENRIHDEEVATIVEELLTGQGDDYPLEV